TIPRSPSTMSKSPEATSANSEAPTIAGISRDRAIMAVWESGLPGSVARRTIRWERSSKNVDGGERFATRIGSYGRFLYEGGGVDCRVLGERRRMWFT